MREAKFKVWDNKKKKWLDDDAVVMLPTGRVEWNVVISDKEEVTGGNFSVPDVTIVWFTGLKGEGGVEIYSGDLFKCIYERDGHIDHIYEVVYSDDSAAFKLKRHGKYCPQYSVIQEIWDVARHGIIGNVKENPELINS